MMTLRRILVPVSDQRRRAHTAALKAVQLARRSGAVIELFHAWDDLVDLYDVPDALDLGKVELAAHERARKPLERLARKLRGLGADVTVAVETDHPAHEAIIRRAVRTGADLIVLDARGHHRAPGVLRVTDWELLRHSPVPVLLVKRRAAYRRPAILAAVDPQHGYSKPSGLDDVILDAGITLENALAGRLHALHCYVPIPLTALSPRNYSADLSLELQRQAKVRARAGLDALLRRTKIPAARRHLVARHPQDAIPDIAHETGAAIVVMGAVSRSGLKRIFIGNTAEQVMDELPCDLLVVKPRGFDARVPKKPRGANWRIAGTMPPAGSGWS